MDEETPSRDESDGSSVGFVENTDGRDGDRRASEIWHMGSEKYDGS